MSRSPTKALGLTKSPTGWVQRNFPFDKFQTDLLLNIIEFNAKLQVMFLEYCGFDLQKDIF